MKPSKPAKNEKGVKKEPLSKSKSDKNLKKLAMLKPQIDEEEKKFDRKKGSRKQTKSPQRKPTKSESPHRSPRASSMGKKRKSHPDGHLVPDQELDKALKRHLKVKSNRDNKEMQEELESGALSAQATLYNKKTMFTKFLDKRFSHYPAARKLMLGMKDEVLAATKVFETHLFHEMMLTAVLKYPDREEVPITEAVIKEVFQKMHLSFLHRNFSMYECFKRDLTKEFKKELSEEAKERQKERGKRLIEMRMKKRAAKKKDSEEGEDEQEEEEEEEEEESSDEEA